MSQLSPAYVLVHITNLSVPSTLAILIGLFKAMDKGNLNSELLFHWNPSFWGFFFGFFFSILLTTDIAVSLLTRECVKCSLE